MNDISENDLCHYSMGNDGFENELDQYIHVLNQSRVNVKNDILRRRTIVYNLDYGDVVKEIEKNSLH